MSLRTGSSGPPADPKGLSRRFPDQDLSVCAFEAPGPLPPGTSPPRPPETSLDPDPEGSLSRSARYPIVDTSEQSAQPLHGESQIWARWFLRAKDPTDRYAPRSDALSGDQDSSRQHRPLCALPGFLRGIQSAVLLSGFFLRPARLAVLRNWFWPAFFGSFVLAGMVGAGWVTWKFLQSPTNGPRYTESKFVSEGTVVHTLVAGKEQSIPDTEPILGVMVDDQPRAYVLQAFSGSVQRSLLHDNSGENPVVVSCCGRTMTIRVFGGGEQPLPMIQLGGWRADQTQELLVNGQSHSQKSETLPLSELPFEQTTWGAWKTAHPETRVYTGRE